MGDGTQIDIWLDPWIPDGVTRRPVTPKGYTLRRVSELIDPISAEWDSQLIKSVFWEEDVQRILGIPIKMAWMIFWHGTMIKKGFLSVNSAYHVLDDGRKREQPRQQGESSSTPGQGRSSEFKWKSIWKLNCPPKIKHFFWRFAHNSLSLMKNIARRGMDIDTRCPVC